MLDISMEEESVPRRNRVFGLFIGRKYVNL